MRLYYVMITYINACGYMWLEIYSNDSLYHDSTLLVECTLVQIRILTLWEHKPQLHPRQQLTAVVMVV